MVIHLRAMTLVVLAAVFLAGLTHPVAAQKKLFEAYLPVIAIDPGHGGDENGAKAPDGVTEKEITLNLARMLANELDRNYKVVLSRTEDNPVDLDQRTALANYHKSDLFISIHAGGSFAHSTSGQLIYHYQDLSEDPREPAEIAPNQGQKENAPLLWDRAQSRHLEKSRLLARLLQNHLSALAADQNVHLQGAPLSVLQGANMPAILIEIGYLTNPKEGKKLSDQRYLNDLAQAIRRGIDDYFKQISE